MGVYPQFLLAHMPTGLAGLRSQGCLPLHRAHSTRRSTRWRAVRFADLYWPLQRWRGRFIDDRSERITSRIAVLITGLALIATAIVSAWRYNPNQDSLLDFALGVMSFAYTGMLGVFLTALLTKRGNTISVLAALAAGVIVTTLLQDSIFGWWTGHIFGSPMKLASFWWMPIGTVISFAICVSGLRLNRWSLAHYWQDACVTGKRQSAPPLPPAAHTPPATSSPRVRTQMGHISPTHELEKSIDSLVIRLAVINTGDRVVRNDVHMCAKAAEQFGQRFGVLI